VQKRTTEGWKNRRVPSFVNRADGTHVEFKQLTDEDIADAALQAELESDPPKITTMDGTLPIALHS
jgi:hypothetical protein